MTSVETTSDSPATPTDTPWLSLQQQASWRAFLGGVTALMDQLDRDLRQNHGLSMPEYEILVRLSESPDRSIRMAELAAAVGHSRSRVTHTVSRLERNGLVLRGQCSDDGRGVSAVLTDAGFAALERAAHTHVRGVHDYFVAQASATDFATIGSVMQSVVDHLDARPF